MKRKIEPYLKWAGGKRQLVRELKKKMPEEYGKYFEPFVGAGALFFYLGPEKAVINDANVDLMVTYSAIRDDIDGLIGLLRDYQERNTSEDFYKIRKLDRIKSECSKMTDTEKAARTIYLNKTCYNGLYRVNSQGHFNTPFGGYKRPVICDEALLRNIHNHLNESDIEIKNGDFENAVASAKEGDFVYFDPPYHSQDNTNFTSYQSGGFNENEQMRLKVVFDKLTEKGIKCILSNSKTEFITSLYGEYKIKTVRMPRMINCDGNNRGEVDEVIIKNW